MLLSCGAECTRLPSDHILIWRQHAEDAEVLKTLKMLRQQSACGITLLASSRQCGARRGAALGWTGTGKAHVQLRGSPAGQACTRAATPKLVCTPCPLHRRIVECVCVLEGDADDPTCFPVPGGLADVGCTPWQIWWIAVATENLNCMCVCGL